MAVTVLRLDRPTGADLERCVAASQPAILTGLMNEQLATRRWDVPYLRRQLGARTVKVVEQDQPRLYWDPVAGLPLRSVCFDEFVEGTSARRGPGFAYLQDDVNNIVPIEDDYRLPALMEERGIVLGPFLQAAEPILGDRARHAAAARAVEEWTRARGTYGSITLFVVGGRTASP